MIFYSIIFEVTGSTAKRCYSVGDKIIADDIRLIPPEGKGLCTLLIPRLLDIIEKEELQNLTTEKKEFSFSCKGDKKTCHGILDLKVHESLVGDKKARKNIGKVLKLISKIDFFKNFSALELRSLFPLLSYKKSIPKDIIIHKGDQPGYVFIVLSGSAEMFDGEKKIADLVPGDIFGEMSLLGRINIDATVIVNKSAWIIQIKGSNFQKIVTEYPKAQMFMIKLLSQQLAETTTDQIDEIETVMSGKLTHLPPAELLQMLNTGQKTGSLVLELSKGNAEVDFWKGDLQNVKYDNLTNEEAFYDILKENKGKFNFYPGDDKLNQKTKIIGSFMGLLLEGLQRLDEDGVIE